MREAKIKVLLVDDHPLTLSGIFTFLKSKKRIRIVGKAFDGIEAIQKAKKLIPDVVLMDIGLPRMNGLEALRVLRQELPTTKVLVLTMHDNKEYVQESMRLGASGYVLKSSSPKDLAFAIETIYADGVYVSSKFLSLFRSGNDDGAETHHHTEAWSREKSLLGEEMVQLSNENYKLTAREKEILTFIVEGNTMHQIAQKLTLSYNTMTTHFKHIYRKLKVHNRGSAVAKVFREHII